MSRTIAQLIDAMQDKFEQDDRIQVTGEEIVELISALQETPTAQKAEFSIFFPGVPADSAVIWGFESTRDLVLPEDLAGSTFTLGTAATAETVLTINVDGTPVGTITFAISGTDGTIVLADGVTVAAGEVLTIDNQADNDATAADIMGSLVGTLQDAA